MLYSKLAHATGTSSGFFLNDDKNAPADSVSVSDADHMAAINLPQGSTYDFDANGVLSTTAPTTTYLLAQAQTAQLGLLTSDYDSAIQTPVSFTTAAGATNTYQADAGSQDVLVKTLQRCLAAGAVPTGFYWVAADNTQVPFTLADLQGLDAAMFTQGWLAFQNLQTKKTAVNAAVKTGSVAAVQAVVW